METCPNCNRSFPDGSLVDVFRVDKSGQGYTKQLLCRECGLKATEGGHRLEIEARKKKWWELWK